MIEDSPLFNERITKREDTEDGDFAITVTVRAKGFAGVKAYNAERGNYVTRSGVAFGTLDSWVGAGGGWLMATYSYLVDGAEVAIEAQNDAWAHHQQELEDAAFRFW